MAQRIYLVGPTEVGKILGNLSRQRVYQITVQPDFPAPVAELAQGKVWLGDQVEAWAAARRARIAKIRPASAVSGQPADGDQEAVRHPPHSSP